MSLAAGEKVERELVAIVDDQDEELGIREHEAVTHGISSKGPWVLSASQAVHQALSVDYLSARGLASLLEIWTKLAAKKRTA